MPNKSTSQLSQKQPLSKDTETIPPKSNAEKTIIPPFDTFPIDYAKYGLLGIIAFLLLAFFLFIISILFGVDISRLFI